jgi:phosphoadenosine phosphosulfate reductase
LRELEAWITGLRSSQSQTRSNLRKVEVDREHGDIIKINPLADWTRQQVWDYIHEYDVPYNRLYDQGYTSIGCAPCTRSVIPGEDERAGRWWWENGVPKECGIHWRVSQGAMR